MDCSAAFFLALKTRKVRRHYSKSSIYTYRYMFRRGTLGIDAVYKVLRLAGYEMIRESQWRVRKKKIKPLLE